MMDNPFPFFMGNIFFKLEVILLKKPVKLDYGGLLD
ncbi:hypothetical protein SAMN05444394_0363 [Algoriphagus halophilus]|uniref:Uncharacterized protein n=1 Tax=Algoriphagus halophilus TaxID=226505 RepID=A0A1N6D6Z0_9BACT|nr:hypothetical protein SAMN05444394_0363 [Algoriphagus halophilus]